MEERKVAQLKQKPEVEGKKVAQLKQRPEVEERRDNRDLRWRKGGITET